MYTISSSKSSTVLTLDSPQANAYISRLDVRVVVADSLPTERNDPKMDAILGGQLYIR